MADNNIKDKEEKTSENEEKEKEIDILAMVYALWSKKKLILMWCLWGALAGLIIAFSIPREYTTKVALAPESRTRTTGSLGSLSALASMAGLSAAANTTSDAVYPQLYPDIVGSVPFIMSLMDVPVTDKEDKTFTVREYITEETSGPWWGYIFGAPRMVINAIRGGGKDKEDEQVSVDSLLSKDHVLRISMKDDGLVRMMRNRVKADVDQKTNVITISVEMQDPVISAVLADTVVARLREFVTNYRTNKARNDLEYSQKLYADAQQEYYSAQQRLADFTDRNQNLATQSAKINQERLENEASLAFNVYNQTALQVQNAKSRVQENTPVYTELTPATVPLRPTSPRKGLIIAGCTFLAFAACCAWILFGTPLLEEYKRKVKEAKESKDSANTESNS